MFWERRNGPWYLKRDKETYALLNEMNVVVAKHHGLCKLYCGQVLGETVTEDEMQWILTHPNTFWQNRRMEELL